MCNLYCVYTINIYTAYATQYTGPAVKSEFKVKIMQKDFFVVVGQDCDYKVLQTFEPNKKRNTNNKAVRCIVYIWIG